MTLLKNPLEGGQNICFSGGADGADLAWGDEAHAHGHRVVHYVPPKASTEALVAERFYLTESQLKAADPYLLKANETLKRGDYGSYCATTKNLLRRNYYQIATTECVYAISNKEIDGNRVKGGTAWAVQMAIDKGIPKIYLFDQRQNYWLFWLGWKWDFTEEVPVPHGLYTGIGSRELTEKGRQAIKDVYKPR